MLPAGRVNVVIVCLILLINLVTFFEFPSFSIVISGVRVSHVVFVNLRVWLRKAVSTPTRKSRLHCLHFVSIGLKPAAKSLFFSLIMSNQGSVCILGMKPATVSMLPVSFLGGPSGRLASGLIRAILGVCCQSM